MDELLDEAAKNNIDPDLLERYLLLDPYSGKFQLFSPFELRLGIIGSEYLDSIILPSLMLLKADAIGLCAENYGIGDITVDDSGAEYIFFPDHLPERFLSERVREWADDHMESG